MEQERLYLKAQFIDLVEEKNATVRLSQQAAALRARLAGMAAPVAGQGLDRDTAAQRRAGDANQTALHTAAPKFQSVNPLRKFGFSGTGFPKQQDRRIGDTGHLLDPVDQRAIGRVARPDAATEQVDVFAAC